MMNARYNCFAGIKSKLRLELVHTHDKAIRQPDVDCVRHVLEESQVGRELPGEYCGVDLRINKLDSAPLAPRNEVHGLNQEKQESVSQEDFESNGGPIRRTA